MKIATHNVEFLFDEGSYNYSGTMWSHSKDYVDARVNYFAKLFSEIDADVLFLQELGSENVLKRIIARSGIQYSYFIATPDKNNVGNAVLYKSASCRCESVEATSSFPVMVEGDPDVIGPRLWSRRHFVRLETTYNENPLYLFGLHLKARFPVRLKNSKKIDYPITTQLEAADSLIRSEIFTFMQARRMREELDILLAKNPNAQIAVMGDFNAVHRDTAFRIVQGELETIDGMLTSLDGRASLEQRYSFIGSHGRKLIDHILVSKSLEPAVQDFEILNETLKQHSNVPPDPAFIESDHAPLVMVLA